MIKIQSIQIEEFRGIRKLSLELKGKNFAICGRNGTGKSGIVDAIEFGLTGNISRLSGEGTDKLSVREHAPHVDMRGQPEKAIVRLTVTIPSLNKTFTITRSPKDPRKPILTPSSPEALAVLRQIEAHPEIVLTRREIIRYVLAPEGKRATEVQAVLRLEALGHVRQLLQTIANGYTREAGFAATATRAAAADLRGAVRVPKLTTQTLLTAVNAQRAILELPALPSITASNSVRDGITAADGSEVGKIVKSAALEDVATLRAQLQRLTDPAKNAELNKAIKLCSALADDAVLLSLLTREGFLRSGLDFVDQPTCPFCDNEWDIGELRRLVEEKLAKMQKAKQSRTKAEAALEPIVLLFEETAETLRRIVRHARSGKQPLATLQLRTLGAAVVTAKAALQAFLPIERTVSTCETPIAVDAVGMKEIADIETMLKALPEPTKQQAARDYLTVAQERLTAYRKAKQKQVRAETRAALSTKVAGTYAATVDDELDQLYKVVEKEFAIMYGELNAPDEANFAARLVPSVGKLGFGVNFYGRGMFPPGAYHSEGHQDAMGLCLYLALMRHVLKDNFQLAVLDDVLMSVDAGHRRAICVMLKKRFPNTQFILTTHDPVWLNHMRTEELVTAKGLVRFRAWDVSAGPSSFDDADIWTEIEKELKEDRVPVAAELLRNHLEYTAAELCHRLFARTEHRLDERFELGMLLPPAYEQLATLYSKGKDAANSWNQKDVVAQLTERHQALLLALKATHVDQWQMNAAIHYNSWASLLNADFRPLVEGFRALIDRFRCPTCQTFFVVLKEAGTLKSMTCDCGQSNVNLAGKVGKAK